MLFSNLPLGLPSGLFLACFSTRILYAPVLSLVRAHLILLDLMTRIFGEEYNHKARRYVLFSTPLLPRPIYAQVPCSAPCS